MFGTNFIMKEAQYLISLKKTAPERVRDTWKAMGGLTCSNDTKIYFKGMIYKLNNEDSELNGALIYCEQEYKVDSTEKQIEWEMVQTLDDLQGLVTFGSGIQSVVFKLIMTAEELDSVKKIPVDTNYVPFQDYQKETFCVNIPDKDYYIIMSEAGVPFITEDELEFNKQQIINIFIQPVLEKYWTHFPYVKQQAIGRYGAGQPFKILMPEHAYNAIPFYTIGAAGATSGSNYTNALSFMRTEMMYGNMGSMGSNSRWGSLRYNKPVPGFTGGMSYTSMALDANAARQGMMNYFRREAFQKIVEDGKKYITGYTSIGGYLNVKWLMCPYDWNLIEFEDLVDVRKACTGNILQNIGLLRSQVKGDVPGNIDYSLFTQRGDKLTEEVMKKWEASSANYMHALTRG